LQVIFDVLCHVRVFVTRDLFRVSETMHVFLTAQAGAPAASQPSSEVPSWVHEMEAMFN
jgi:hypothetical protein